MDYLKFKKEYPLTITNYMNWVGNLSSKNSYSFLGFLEYFYDTNCAIGVAEEYYEILTIEKIEFINILKKSNLPLNYTEDGIVFNLNGQLEEALKSVEYLLFQRHN